MKFRRLGDSDLEVSEISLGSWLTYSGGSGASRPKPALAPRSRPASTSSTPPTSMVGAPPRRPGARSSPAMTASPSCLRPDLFPMSETDRGLAAKQIEKQLDASLRAAANRLRRPLSVPPLRPRDADRGDDGGADRRCRSGKARDIGFSEWTPQQIRAALEVPGAVKPVSSQPQYT